MSVGAAAKLAAIVAVGWYLVFMIIWTIGVLNDSGDVVSHRGTAMLGGALVYGPLSALIVYFAAFIWGLWAVVALFVVRKIRGSL